MCVLITPVSRIVIRLAVPNDQRRLVAAGLLGPPPAGSSNWDDRLRAWFAEQQRAYRLILVADDGSTFLGMAHILFKPPEGLNDPEVVNGKDTALMEHLRIRAKTPVQLAEQVANQLEREAENLARRRNMTLLTYGIPGESAVMINQARAWGFVEFRVMNDAGKNLVFMRKRLVEFQVTPPPAATQPPGSPAAKPPESKPPAGKPTETKPPGSPAAKPPEPKPPAAKPPPAKPPEPPKKP